MEAKLGTKLVAALVLMAALNFQSCKDDDDDSSPDLVGDWELQSSDTYTSSYDVELEFESDNDFTIDVSYDNYGYNYSYSRTGEWDYDKDDEEIEMDYDNYSDETWEVDKLDDDELDVTDESNDEHEFERQ